MRKLLLASLVAIFVFGMIFEAYISQMFISRNMPADIMHSVPFPAHGTTVYISKNEEILYFSAFYGKFIIMVLYCLVYIARRKQN